MRVLITGAAGRFQRQRQIWAPAQWDDGYVDNRGRFRVYRPDCPRAYKGGYALRAHVVWWLSHGEPHPEGMVLHHINENKLDDVLDNLRLIESGAHTTLHCRQLHSFVCEHCGATFTKTGREVSRRRSEGALPKFCSQACFHAHPRSLESRQRHSESLKRAYAEGRR